MTDVTLNDVTRRAQALQLALLEALEKAHSDGLSPQEQQMFLNLVKVSVYTAIGFHVAKWFENPNDFLSPMLKTEPSVISAAFNIGVMEARKKLPKKKQAGNS